MPSLRVIAGLLAVELTCGVVAAVALQPTNAPAPHAAPVRGRVMPTQDRAAAVRGLLRQRATAVAHHDRAAWLATVDPAEPAFAARQAALFDALSAVPLSEWSYTLDPAAPPPAEVPRPGGWAPGVTLTYRLAGFDARPAVEQQHLTFVPRGSSWYVAADDDFAGVGADTPRAIWDGGPVTVVRGRRSLVLGHPGSRSLMRSVAAVADDAVPRVTAVWGSDWAQRVVVLVPSTQDEMARIIGPGSWGQIAAVATAELTDGARPAGDRVVVNPANFTRLGAVGRQVVVTHEVTHVATRAATGAATPDWLVEGFADYVGYDGLHVPYRVSAQELQAEVRRGAVPAALPSDRAFDGGNRDLAATYEQAWLAVTLLADQHGRAGLLRFYRTAGRAGADVAFRTVLHTTAAAFTASWRRDLRARLS